LSMVIVPSTVDGWRRKADGHTGEPVCCDARVGPNSPIHKWLCPSLL
jgi:hypothetical protein